jgi:hypothetical protein
LYFSVSGKFHKYVIGISLLSFLFRKSSGSKGEVCKRENKWKKEVGKIEQGRKTQKWEMISTTSSSCGMITPCGLSRI